MRKILEFEKSGFDDNWYCHIEGYEPYDPATQMVAGADVLLEILSYLHKKSSRCIKIIVSDTIPKDYDYELLIDSESHPIDNGADYIFQTDGRNLDIYLKIWLCPVFNGVFNYYPDMIYLKILE